MQMESNSFVEVCSDHLRRPPPPLALRISTPVPPDLERILFQCLEKEPARRPESARSLHDALDACESAGQWTEERARDWWLEHEKQVKMVGAGKALSATALSPRSQVTATVFEPLRV